MLWWLMQQAKARNPQVQFFGLAWCFPGWVGSAYSRKTAEYIAAWCDMAAINNVPVSYIGLTQNEHPPCNASASSE